MRSAAIGGVLTLALLASSALILLAGPPSSSSSSSSSLPSELLSDRGAHREAAEAADSTAHLLQQQARKAEEHVQEDDLNLSRARTQLKRLQRQLEQARGGESDGAAEGQLAEKEMKKAQGLQDSVSDLQSQIKSAGDRVDKVKTDLVRAKKALVAAKKQAKEEAREKRQLLSKAAGYSKKAAAAESRAKSLRARSNRALDRVSNPHEAEWGHYADDGANLMNEAKAAQTLANKFASRADDARIDAGLVGGIRGNKDVLAAEAQARADIKYDQSKLDRAIVHKSELMARLAAAKTRLSAASLQAGVYRKEQIVAAKARESHRSQLAEIRRAIDKMDDQIDALEANEKSDKESAATLKHKAQSEQQLSEEQLQESDNE